MAEELTPEMNENQNYIDAINQLKETTVEKEKYLRLQRENKQLLDSLISGNSIEQNKPVEAIDKVKATDNLLFGHNNNLEYTRKMLDLRNQLLKEGKTDPFVSIDPLNPVPTEDKLRRAQEVADVLQECIDYADGDVGIFSNELQRRCVDPVVSRVNK